MKWFKRLFGKLTKQDSQATPAAKADEPVETPASVVEKAAESDEAAEKAELPVEDVAPATEPAPSDPAINRLDDDERTAASSLTETEADTEAESEDKPAADIAEEIAADKPVAEPTSAPVASAAEPAEPAEPVAVAPVAEEPAPVEAEVPAPVTPATTAAEDGPFGPGSAKPLADGAAPGAEYTVKGKRSSKLFHTAESPYFGRTKADVWFKTPADAESAGFAAWNHKKKAPAK